MIYRYATHLPKSSLTPSLLTMAHNDLFCLWTSREVHNLYPFRGEWPFYHSLPWIIPLYKEHYLVIFIAPTGVLQDSNACWINLSLKGSHPSISLTMLPALSFSYRTSITSQTPPCFFFLWADTWTFFSATIQLPFIRIVNHPSGVG